MHDVLILAEQKYVDVAVVPKFVADEQFDCIAAGDPPGLSLLLLIPQFCDLGGL
ncbi:hypothetical protein [Kribbella sp. VKM Ac-2569]|uniref:hypothetical protein n=1 Tax=Kribbella sp. VKM Ac-2569 TaxID=2512220 RepID=UPI001F542208|nr:hypothetical protein [Kribbella sp. VKM Ac-2569]